MELYRQKKHVGGATRPHEAGGAPRGGVPSTLVTSPETSWSRVQVSWILFVPKITFPKVYSVWTPFDIPFLRNTETREKTETGTGLWVNRLVPKKYKSA